MVLHDHLDGGLRPQTIIDLALQNGYGALPATEAGKLGQWFRDSADSGSLERYLETFAHTVGVMQTAEGISRVAREATEDFADDGVVYAEIRWAPEQHVDAGLSLEQVVDAVLDGFRQGEAAAAERGKRIRVGALVTAMRHAARSSEIAELAVAYRGENFHFTIHAGEAFGLPSIWEAIQWCGADRLGHGVRIADDIADVSGGPVLGRLAQYVRDKRIPLEMCPSSNVQTGAARSIAEHPIGLLRKLYFRVTVNTDNRLMSGTSMSREMALLADAFGYGWDDLQWFTINAMKSAFIPFDERLDIINNVIKPGYAALTR